MVNRFLLIGAGVVLGGGMFALSYFRDAEAARANPETVIDLEGARAQSEAEALMQAPTITKGTVLYACPDGHAFAITYGAPGGRATLVIDGDSVLLEPIYVASGAQFTDGHYTFRVEGDLAALVLGEEVIQENCRVSHEATAAAAASN
jgi:membrane-bound inhibitor of C-type lysozyme